MEVGHLCGVGERFVWCGVGGWFVFKRFSPSPSSSPPLPPPQHVTGRAVRGAVVEVLVTVWSVLVDI